MLGNRPLDCVAEGRALSGDHLAASLRRFIASHPDLKDVSHLTPHGWRAMRLASDGGL